MSAVISVLASDGPSAAAALYGTFDRTNRAFLERHLRALEGDVVIDCRKASSLDDEALAILHAFREEAARDARRVVIKRSQPPINDERSTMFRMIRRAPWIALGAAAAYYADKENGAARRDRVTDRVREMSEQLSGRMKDQWQSADVSTERVASRAEQPLAEEQAAGVSPEAAPAMAEQILKDSERRVADRAGTAAEHRSSEQAVEPPTPVEPTGPVTSGARGA